MLPQTHINQRRGEIQRMRSRINHRLDEITSTALVVGIDIVKNVHWSRFVDYRGRETGKAISFTNDRDGFCKIITMIEKLT